MSYKIDNVDIRFRTMVALKYAILDLQEAQYALEFVGDDRLREVVALVDKVAGTMSEVAVGLESRTK